MTSKNSFFSKKVQEVHTSLDGEITQSSNTIFELTLGDSIYAVHPFFESLRGEFVHTNELNLAFPCVQLEITGKRSVCDITIKKQRGELAILFFDYSQHYEHLHAAAQEKKEAMLQEQSYESAVTNQEEENAYSEFIQRRIDIGMIHALEEVVGHLEKLKNSHLSAEQRTLIQEIEQNIGHLHLKAIQIKEGLNSRII